VEIFKDRNFVIGLGFMFITGILLLASAALMAPFLTGIMGYPIVDAGWLLGARGIGMAIAMLFAGRIMGITGPRLMLFAGLALSASSLYLSIDFTPDTAPRTIAWVSAVQGVGLAFLFVPLNTVALSTLPAAFRTEGTATWTLIRNLGSSIGVSIVIANLTNKTTLMRARLVENVTDFNPGLTDPLAAPLNPATEQGRALLENVVNQQAAIIAYANDFKLMMLLCLLAVPFVFLIKTPPALMARAKPPPVDAH
jgi:DHA2 family multidrug resistance protein